MAKILLLALTCNLNCGGNIRLDPTGAFGRCLSSTLPTGSSCAPWAMMMSVRCILCLNVHARVAHVTDADRRG